MSFAYPWVFLLGILLPLLWWLRIRLYRNPTVLFASFQPLTDLQSGSATLMQRLAMVCRIAALALMLIALARPQQVEVLHQNSTEGIDIMLALDVSDSMAAEDFQPNNRLEAAKIVLANFVQERTDDRIGLVVFGDYALTQCPLTTDKQILLRQIDQISLSAAGGRTAIGMGLAAALNRLQNSKAKSKVVILLTDGVNNSGDVSPQQAAELARDTGVKVYTIGVGKEGGAPIPVQHPTLGKVYAKNPDGSIYMTEIDETPLKQMARITGGKYFRAQDTSSLSTIYSDINQLEKIKINTAKQIRITDYFPWFLYAALFFLLMEWVLHIRSGRRWP